MKKLLVVLALLAVACAVYAETDAKALAVIDDIRKGRDNINQIIDLRVLDDATIGDDITIAGDATMANLELADDLSVATNLVVGGTANIAGAITASNSMSLVGDIAVNGDDITCDADLTITAATGGVNLNTNVTCSGTLSASQLWLGTNGYFAVLSTNIVFVGSASGLTNVVVSGF